MEWIYANLIIENSYFKIKNIFLNFNWYANYFYYYYFLLNNARNVCKKMLYSSHDDFNDFHKWTERSCECNFQHLDIDQYALYFLHSVNFFIIFYFYFTFCRVKTGTKNSESSTVHALKNSRDINYFFIFYFIVTKCCRYCFQNIMK